LPIPRRLWRCRPNDLSKGFKSPTTSTDITDIPLKDARSAISTAMERSGMPLLELRYLTGHATSDIMNRYVTLEPRAAKERCFLTIGPLLQAVEQRAQHFGL
jgi:hypothetical protein